MYIKEIIVCYKMPVRYIIFFLLLFLSLMENSRAQQFKEVANLANLDDLKNNNGHAVADYDLDGDLDIFMVALNSFSPEDSTTWSRLLQNNGDNAFIDVTLNAGFGLQYVNPGEEGSEGQKMGAAWGDFNNDGYPDLLLTHYRKVELYINNKDGTFTDITSEAGIAECYECYNSSALWWDYDKDGDLDLYISDWQEPNRLYQNQGDGTFADKTSYTNLGDPGNTWTSIPIDANRDGWPDLYLANDYFRNKFYLNMNGDYFMEATSAYGLEDYGNGMGIATGDYNNDGLFDIYLTNIFEFYPNPLFKALPSGVFENKADEMGVDSAGWAWGTSFFDADLDGDEDLYIVNGHDYSHHSNFFYKNIVDEGSSSFIDWSVQSGADGPADAMSLTTFDYDNDGDLDMLVSNTDTLPYLYQNIVIRPDITLENSWLKVELEGTISNRDGFGTIVKAAAAGKVYHRYYHGAGLLSQNLLPVHFGLGKINTLDSLMIVWPNSPVEVFYNIPVNQTVRVIEQQEFIAEVPSSITSINDAPDDIQQYPFKSYPNPFKKSIIFEFEVAVTGNIRLEIFTVQGMRLYVTQVYNKNRGKIRIEWEGVNMNAIKQPSGMYLYNINVDEASYSGKIFIHR